MNIRKKLLLICFIILAAALCSTLLSCGGKELSFDNLEIIVSDLTDIPEGEVTVMYYIENEEEYKRELGLKVFLSVANEKGESVPVINGKAALKVNNVYTVTVLAENRDGTRTKQADYTITMKKTTVTVSFISSEGYFEKFTRSVVYGGSLTDIPEVPDVAKEADKRNTYTLVSKTWSYANFHSIKENIEVNAVYTFMTVPIVYYAEFESNGGGSFNVMNFHYENKLALPVPEKAGKIFKGWYTEGALVNRVDAEHKFTGNVKLYAGWSTDNGADASYYVFKENAGGYTVSLKENAVLPEILTVPNCYNGKAVTEIAEKCFWKKSGIKKVILPDTLLKIGEAAFMESGVENIEILSQDLLYIPYLMCRGSVNLVSVNIPRGVKYIGAEAFYGCTMLENAEMSPENHLYSIGAYAFYGCESLKSFSVYFLYKYDENYDYIFIGEKAFYNCRSLSEFICNSIVPPQFESADVFKAEYTPQEGLQTVRIIDGLKIIVPADAAYIYRSLYNKFGLWHRIVPDSEADANSGQ